jgi:hypothetical protein
MTAVTMCATPLAPPVPRLLPMAPTRLALTRGGTGADRLDGAWWPRSRDLGRELPALISALDMRFGRIDRVTVNRSQWPDLPRRITVAGHTIDLGWFSAGRTRCEVCVLSNTAGRWDLLVVPPECAFGESEMLMAAAGCLDRPAADAWIATAATDWMSAVEKRATQAMWESEGGAGLGIRAPAGLTGSPMGVPGLGRW